MIATHANRFCNEPAQLRSVFRANTRDAGVARCSGTESHSKMRGAAKDANTLLRTRTTVSVHHDERGLASTVPAGQHQRVTIPPGNTLCLAHRSVCGTVDARLPSKRGASTSSLRAAASQPAFKAPRVFCGSPCLPRSSGRTKADPNGGSARGASLSLRVQPLSCPRTSFGRPSIGR